MEAVVVYGNLIAIIEYHTAPEFSQEVIDEYQKTQNISRKTFLAKTKGNGRTDIYKVSLINRKFIKDMVILDLPYGFIVAINNKVQEIISNQPTHKDITLEKYLSHDN